MPLSTQTVPDPMPAWRAKKDAGRETVLSKYTILGFISSGTYGRVYKAQIKQAPSPSLNPSDPPKPLLYAIKKFKPDKEGERTTYTGISQSAIREISLNRELSVVVDEARDGKAEGGRCENFVTLREVILEDKSIYMVFEYAEHDFLQIIHYHSQTIRQPIPPRTLKSLLHQLVIGVAHLHANFILHRDLKPANILVTSRGVVKIGDLGLARINRDPLLPLWNGDKVVVTIWYRSPELLLGARHYTAAIDLWAVGCIYAELLALRPIFKGEEAKMEAHHAKAGLQIGAGGILGVKGMPFQRDQMSKIVDVLGTPDEKRWSDIIHMPEYPEFARQERRSSSLAHWYQVRSRSTAGYNLLTRLFEYDPKKRVTAKKALDHGYFVDEDPHPMRNAFAGSEFVYPSRRVTHEDNGDPKMGSQPAISSLQAAQNTVAMANLKRNNPSSGSAIPFRPSLQSQLSNGLLAGANKVGTLGGPPARKKTRMG